MIPVHGAMPGNVKKITGLKCSKGSFLLMKVHMILTLKQRGISWRDDGITLQYYFSSVSLIFITYLKCCYFACDVLEMKKKNWFAQRGWKKHLCFPMISKVPNLDCHTWQGDFIAIGQLCLTKVYVGNFPPFQFSTRTGNSCYCPSFTTPSASWAALTMLSKCLYSWMMMLHSLSQLGTHWWAIIINFLLCCQPQSTFLCTLHYALLIDCNTGHDLWQECEQHVSKRVKKLLAAVKERTLQFIQFLKQNEIKKVLCLFSSHYFPISFRLLLLK